MEDRNKKPETEVASQKELDEPTRETSRQDVHYTTFIRLPFARGTFVDPPLVR